MTSPPLTLSLSLRHPIQTIVALHASGERAWRPWAGLTAIAIGGSLLYGASLSAAFPDHDPVRGGLWIALSAGAGWFVLGPGLLLWTRLPVATVAHACMVAMAFGEAWLTLGALANLAGPGWLDPLAANAALFVVANLTMAALLSAQLRAVGVPVLRTLLAWFLLLDGAGAVFFIVLADWLAPAAAP